MKHRFGATLGRRELLCGLTAAAAASSVSVATTAAAAQTTNLTKGRRPGYQADSAEVRTFYRVNRYPKK